MHERDIALLDEAFEPLGVGKHGERILARHGQRDDLAAGLGHGICHAAPCGGNEGLGPGPGQRFGDLDGRLLAAAGVEARHDLQYGQFGHGLRS